MISTNGRTDARPAGLVDLDVAGASVGADGGAAAVDDASDMMAVHAALHGDGLRDVDAAGAGVGVEAEAGTADTEANGAAAGRELPVGGGLAVGFDITGAGAGFERTCKAMEADAAAAGFGFDVAGACLLKFDVAGAGAEDRRAFDAVSTDGAGAALGLEAGADVLDFNVAGAGDGIDRGFAGEGDLVVDADVAKQIGIVAIADGDVVAVLDDGRIVDDLLETGVAASAEPDLAGVNVADDVDLIVRTGMEMDVAGAGGDRDVGRAADVEGAVEVAVCREGGGDGGEGEDGGGNEDSDGHGISL